MKDGSSWRRRFSTEHSHVVWSRVEGCHLHSRADEVEEEVVEVVVLVAAGVVVVPPPFPRPPLVLPPPSFFFSSSFAFSRAEA